MALGSSAPEIILSLIEIMSNNFMAGELGPSTIVGSASFNLFVIVGICVAAIPRSETRKIVRMNVYKVTAFNSLFAYLWLLVILLGTSPDLVEVWEGVLTFLFFPAMLVLAYMADIGMFDSGKPVGKEHETGTVGDIHQFTLEDAYAHMKHIAIASGCKLAEIPPQLVADKITTEHIGKLYFSRAQYRHSAMRKIAGKKENIPAAVSVNHAIQSLLSRPEEPRGNLSVGFSNVQHIVMENCGSLQLQVTKAASLIGHKCTVEYRTVDGEAKAGEDYVAKHGILNFGPNEVEKTINITIIDDDVEEDDETFYVELFNLKCDVTHSHISPAHKTAHILIIDDDRPGIVSLQHQKMTVSEAIGEATVAVLREGGAKGALSVDYATKDGSAISGKDYTHKQGTLNFADGEIEKIISIEVIDDEMFEKNEVFTVELSNPQGASKKLGPNTWTEITIESDDELTSMVEKVAHMLNINYHRFQLGSHSWKEQFADAIFWETDASIKGKIFHVFMFPWNFTAALIPPTLYFGGWAAFLVSLGMIGIVTGVIGDVASLFGCSIGLSDAVTAITFVALGTSLPDTFASRTAALNDDTADNAIGNVTGSNAVNVYLGIGLPWMIAAIYWRVKGATCKWQEEYPGVVKDYPNGGFYVEAGPLGVSVAVFSVCALIVFATLHWKRTSHGGELGGPGNTMVLAFFVCLWLVFVIVSSLKFEGVF